MQKILIANRGEIAIRIIRACRELGIKTVAVHSSVDRDSLHAKLADESVCIGPGPSSKSYLSIPAIMAAAELTGVDGIHPGYGFLSESSEFASVCGQNQIKFIGPSPKHIEVLGNKIQARAAARKANLSLLPGSDGEVDLESAQQVAKQIGFPIMIKAAAGGGGRGLKVVWSQEELECQLNLARTEALAGFGDSSCFMEKFLELPRHVEVQLLGDGKGKVIAFGERDCSIQRRHQKVVEEAPCSILTEEQRKDIIKQAIDLAESIQYESLGTAEFLFDGSQFYFMEMNTRVQVEHPVTEMTFQVDLVKEQIRVARGEGISAEALQRSTEFHGHALECRINAEDPERFFPWPGKITEFHQPGGPGTRVDTMVYNGYTVPSLYDSMIAKVITHGKDRQECLQRMQRALLEMKVDGIRTNIPFLHKILANPAFQNNEISTRFIEEQFTRTSP